MEPEPQKSTLFRSKLFWAIVSVPLVILVTFVGIWIARQSSLDAQLAELRAKGLPTNASEVNDFYVVPDNVTDTTDLWVAAINAGQAAGSSPNIKTLPILGEGPTPIPPPGEAWAELEASRTLLANAKLELQVIHRAGKAGGQVRFPVDFSAGIATLLPLTQNSRSVARLLTLDAHVAAHDGDFARVLQDLKSIFALSDAMRGEPCMVSQLVRIAIHNSGCNAAEELLPHSGWDDAELQSLQAVIGAARFKDGITHSMSGERAISLTALDRMPLGPFRQANKLEALRFYKTSIEGLSGSWSDAIKGQRDLSAEVKKLSASGLSRLRMRGVLLLLPALQQVAIAGARATARQNSAIAVIATERYRLKHGRLPESLTEIVIAMVTS